MPLNETSKERPKALFFCGWTKPSEWRRIIKARICQRRCAVISGKEGKALRLFTPEGYYKKLSAIPVDQLVAQGIRGVILDLDNTINTWNSLKIEPEVLAWFDKLHAAGIKSCILSNNHAPRIAPVAEAVGSLFVGEAKKPMKSGYRRGMKVLGTGIGNTIMVGDQLLTDIFGGTVQGCAAFWWNLSQRIKNIVYHICQSENRKWILKRLNLKSLP